MFRSYRTEIDEVLREHSRAAAELEAMANSTLQGIEHAAQLGELRQRLDKAHARLNELVMQMRARITTDLHLVDGMDFRAIGDALGTSNNSPANWRNDHGPKHYYVIYPPTKESPDYVLGTVPPRQHAVRVALTNGAVLVPARFGFDRLTPEEITQLDLPLWYGRFRHTAQYARRAPQWFDHRHPGDEPS